jgi:hypothetical protein
VYGNYIDEVLLMYTGAYIYYAHDHLYSPAALIFSGGAVLERYEYDAYGDCHVLEPNYADDPDGKSDYGNPYLFTGRRVDILDEGSLKIQYNRNRYYDYYTGRWTTHDPKRMVPNELVLPRIRPMGWCLSNGEYCQDWPPDPQTEMCWVKAQTISMWEPLDQYDEGMNLYEYGLSDPVHQFDPMGKGCKVWYKCGLLNAEKYAWGCRKMCHYSCIEDKSKKRKDVGSLPPDCEDARIPGSIYYSTSVFACFKCPLSKDVLQWWMELQFDWKDCSTKECIAKAKADAKKMKLVCKVLKGKKKKVCEKLAEAIEAGRIALCALCKRS